MAEAHANAMDYGEHRRTYSMFVRLTVAVVIHIAQILVSLVAMAVIGGGAFWIGLVGFVVGLVLVAATLASNLSWVPSLAVLALTAILAILTL